MTDPTPPPARDPVEGQVDIFEMIANSNKPLKVRAVINESIAGEIMKAVVKKFDGEMVSIQIKKARKQRSLKENAYFHGPLLDHFAKAMNDAGYMLFGSIPHNSHSSKEVIKQMFMIPRGYGDSTAGLSTVDFEKIMTDVRKFSTAELGYTIPEPNEDLDSLFNNYK